MGAGDEGGIECEAVLGGSVDEAGGGVVGLDGIGDEVLAAQGSVSASDAGGKIGEGGFLRVEGVGLVDDAAEADDGLRLGEDEGREEEK